MIRSLVASKKCIISLLCCILCAFIGLPANIGANCQIDIEWQPNQTAPDNYRIYQREAGQLYDYGSPIYQGLSTNIPVSGLAENTTYYWVVRAYVGSSHSTDSNEATYTCNSQTQVDDTNPPSRPTAQSPADKTQDVVLEPTLRASSFYDSDSGDHHTQSHWQIFRMDNDNCIYDDTSGTNLTTLKVPPSVLEHHTTYYWTVSYLNQNNGVSQPSAQSDFTTVEETVVEATEEETEEEPQTQATLSDTTGGIAGSSSGGGCFIESLIGF